MNFGSKLRSFRNIYNITQDEIADAMGVERSTYSYYETGRTPPTMEHAKIISKIFFVPLDYLLENTVLANSNQEQFAHPIDSDKIDDPIAKIIHKSSKTTSHEDIVFSNHPINSPTYLLVSDRIKDEMNGLGPTIVQYNDEVFELNRLEKEILVKVRLIEAIYRNLHNEELSESTNKSFATYFEELKSKCDCLSASPNISTEFKELVEKYCDSSFESEKPLYDQDLCMDRYNTDLASNMTADDFIRMICDDNDK